MVYAATFIRVPKHIDKCFSDGCYLYRAISNL
ncbi:hypothetical protein EMIT0P4_470017 [Pseudomonas sp. IT-P4]